MIRLPTQPEAPASAASETRSGAADPARPSYRPEPRFDQIYLSIEQARLFTIAFPPWLFTVERSTAAPFPFRPRLRRDFGGDALRLFLSFGSAFSGQLAALRTSLIDVRERSATGEVIVIKRRLSFDEAVLYMMQQPINPRVIHAAAARSRRGNENVMGSNGAEFTATLMAAMPRDWAYWLAWVRNTSAEDPWEIPAWYTLWDQRDALTPSAFKTAWRQYWWQSAVWAFDKAYDYLRLEMGIPLGEANRPVDEALDFIVRDFVLRIKEPRAARQTEPDVGRAPSQALPATEDRLLLAAGDGGAA